MSDSSVSRDLILSSSFGFLLYMIIFIRTAKSNEARLADLTINLRDTCWITRDCRALRWSSFEVEVEKVVG